MSVAPTKEEAQAAYDYMLELTDRLGLALAPNKCTPPTKKLEWLSFLVSINDMTISIPNDKMTDVLLECQAWKTKKLASRKDKHCLVSHLQHIARCIPRGT